MGALRRFLEDEDRSPLSNLGKLEALSEILIARARRRRAAVQVQDPTHNFTDEMFMELARSSYQELLNARSFDAAYQLLEGYPYLGNVLLDFSAAQLTAFARHPGARMLPTCQILLRDGRVAKAVELFSCLLVEGLFERQLLFLSVAELVQITQNNFDMRLDLCKKLCSAGACYPSNNVYFIRAQELFASTLLRDMTSAQLQSLTGKELIAMAPQDLHEKLALCRGLYDAGAITQAAELFSSVVSTEDMRIVQQADLADDECKVMFKAQVQAMILSLKPVVSGV